MKSRDADKIAIKYKESAALSPYLGSRSQLTAEFMDNFMAGSQGSSITSTRIYPGHGQNSSKCDAASFPSSQQLPEIPFAIQCLREFSRCHRADQ